MAPSLEPSRNFREAIKRILEDYDSTPARGFCPYIYAILNDLCQVLVKKSAKSASKNNGFLTENDVLSSMNEIFPENLKRSIFQKMIADSQTRPLIQKLDDSAKRQIIPSPAHQSRGISGSAAAALQVRTDNNTTDALIGNLTQNLLAVAPSLAQQSREISSSVAADLEVRTDNNTTAELVGNLTQNLLTVADTLHKMLNDVEDVTQVQHDEIKEITGCSTEGIGITPMDVDYEQRDEMCNSDKEENKFRSYMNEHLLEETGIMQVNTNNAQRNEMCDSQTEENEFRSGMNEHLLEETGIMTVNADNSNVMRSERHLLTDSQTENDIDKHLLNETTVVSMSADNLNMNRNEIQSTDFQTEGEGNGPLLEENEMTPMDIDNENIQRNEGQSLTDTQTENGMTERLLEEIELMPMDVDCANIQINERQADFQMKECGMTEYLFGRWYYFLPFFPFL